jgi:hypothetical protein
MYAQLQLAKGIAKRHAAGKAVVLNVIKWQAGVLNMKNIMNLRAKVVLIRAILAKAMNAMEPIILLMGFANIRMMERLFR